MIQNMKTFQYISPHKQTERQKKIISLYTEKKAFDKIKDSFMIKELEKSGIHGAYLNIIKARYSKPIPNIKLYGEKLKAILVKLGTKQVVTLLLTY